MASRKLKITNPNGLYHVVNMSDRNLKLHLKRNSIQHSDKRDKLEEVEGIELDSDGKIVKEGKVIKLHHEGAVNVKSALAEKESELAEKDAQIEALKKQLAAQKPAASPQTTSAPKK